MPQIGGEGNARGSGGEGRRHASSRKRGLSALGPPGFGLGVMIRLYLTAYKIAVKCAGQPQLPPEKGDTEPR
jgi:hypothetical protein